MKQAEMFRKLADSREEEILHLQQLLGEEKNSESRIRQEFSLMKSYVAKQDAVIQQHQENLKKLSGAIPK